MKLNLGCADRIMDGYENIDILDGKLAYPLDCEDGSVEEIYASHILEHYSWKNVPEVLSHWVSKLQPGGVVKLAVPDMKKIAKMILDGSNEKALMYAYGDQRDEHNFHHAGFTEDNMRNLMDNCGLGNIETWTSEFPDDASLPVSLNLMGTKVVQQTIQRTIGAVMSVPRLGFTDNTKCLLQGFPPGVSVKQGQGAFWGQILTRMIKESLLENYDYIFTVDYDTWFTQHHVHALLKLMEENPEYDAIFPVQIKRQSETVMVGCDEGKKEFTKEDLASDVIAAKTGHFGLTVFRKSAFEGLKKPWFLGVPNSGGEWEEDRLDPDIYFWHNFYDCGKKLGLARNVSIGHIQLMATFPAKEGSGDKVIHMHMSDVNESGGPEWCVPR